MIKNIKYLKDCTKGKNHNIGITSQYSIYNAMNLSELHEYFANNDELFMKINYYLNNEQKRLLIAKSGHIKCLDNGYSYNNSMSYIFSYFKLY